MFSSRGDVTRLRIDHHGASGAPLGDDSLFTVTLGALPARLQLVPCAPGQLHAAVGTAFCDTARTHVTLPGHV